MHLLKYSYVLALCFLYSLGLAQMDQSEFKAYTDSIAVLQKDSVELVEPFVLAILNNKDYDLDSLQWIEMQRRLGRANRKVGNYVQSISNFKIVYDFSKVHLDSFMMVEAANQIGIMNTFMGNMQEGQTYLLEVADIYDKIGSVSDKAGANNGLAIFYNDMSQYDKAEKTYKLALSQYESVDDTMGRANIHANLGMMYISLNRLDEARENIEMQGYLDTLLNTQWGLGFHYDLMGHIEEKSGDITEALRWYQQALKTRLSLPSHYNIAESRAGLSKCYYKIGEWDRAIEEANLILEYKEEHQSLSQQMSAYSLLTSIYEDKKDYQKSLEYYKKFKTIADSIFQRDMLSEIANKDALYQKVKKEEQIAMLSAEQKLTANKLQNRNRIIWFGGLTMLVILALLTGLYKSLEKIKRQKLEISKSLEEKDLLLREIHHRVKNNLQMVSSLLSLQSRTIDDATAVEAITAGKSRVRSMALIHQDLYRSESLTGIGAKQYLEKLIQELFNTYHISNDQIKLNLDIEDLNIDVDTIVPIGLILNELITNSLKYAWPDRKEGALSIKLYHDDDLLHMSVADDGIGYDAAKIRNQSFGSTLVQALTQQLDGELEVIKDNGTESRFKFREFTLK